MSATAPSTEIQNGPIVLFDAECVLCSAQAKFILENDKAGHFRLASMQSDMGAALYVKHDLDPKDPSTMLIIEETRVRRDSDAVLSIYEALGLPWRLLAILRLAPALLRDPVYRWFARNRYRLFGKRTHCWVPPPEFKDRFL